MNIFYHKNSPTVIYCPPKCGTITLECSGHFTYDEKPVDRKILLIREPHKRYISGYLYLLFKGNIRIRKNKDEHWEPSLPFSKEGFSRFTNHHLYNPYKRQWYDPHVAPQSHFHKSRNLDYSEFEFVEASKLSKFVKTIQPDWEHRILNQSHLKWIFDNEQLFERCYHRWLELYKDDLEIYKDLHSKAYKKFK